MAIAVESTFPGSTLEQYDAAIKEMGLTPGGTHPGAMFHWVAATDSGIRVTDVWETNEQWEQFLAEQVIPAAQKVGLSAPETRVIEVHNYLVGR